jgi:hypothetical protein
MAYQPVVGRGAIAFVMGGVVVALAVLVWYLVAADGGNPFSRTPAGPSITIELPAVSVRPGN